MPRSTGIIYVVYTRNYKYDIPCLVVPYKTKMSAASFVSAASAAVAVALQSTSTLSTS